MLNNFYVIYDKANDQVVQWSNGKVVLYLEKDNAYNDCYVNEFVVSVDKLPNYWKDAIASQLKK
jgi:hypothetical protein